MQLQLWANNIVDTRTSVENETNIWITEDVLAPSAGKASRSVELSIPVGKTDDVDVVHDLDRLIQDQKSNVVEKSSSVELLVDNDILH